MEIFLHFPQLVHLNFEFQVHPLQGFIYLNCTLTAIPVCFFRQYPGHIMMRRLQDFLYFSVYYSSCITIGMLKNNNGAGIVYVTIDAVAKTIPKPFVISHPIISSILFQPKTKAIGYFPSTFQFPPFENIFKHFL